MALENFPYLLLVLLVIGVGYRSYFAPSDKSLTKLPLAIDHQGFLSSLRNKISSLGNVNIVIGDAYKKFSKSRSAFILPGLHQNIVILPASSTKWLISQADDALSAKIEQKDSLQTDRTLLDATLANNPLHENIIRRELTRQIATLIPEVEDELAAGLTEYFGTDEEEWKEVCVFDTMMKIVSRASNRVFVGLPLCRNEEYLSNAAAFASDIAISSALLRLFPDFLKPIVAPVILLPNRWHIYKCSKHLIPLARSRISSFHQEQESKPTTEKSDFLTWSVREATSSPDPSEMSPEKIAMRIMTVNFAVIHTSTFTATNLLLDFYSSPTTPSDVQTLRAEMEPVFAESGDKWTKVALAKLNKTDSAMRESMRTSIFQSYGMTRQVIAKDGLVTDTGLHLPRGTKVAVAASSIHYDDEFYEEAHIYKPFRFSTAREDVVASSTAEAGGEDAEKKSLARFLESKNLSAVTTTDTFLGFGHGKHACPGRFFATAEIKMLLAYVVMNYDVKPMETRPSNVYFGGTILPPMKATIMVRRKKRSA